MDPHRHGTLPAHWHGPSSGPQAKRQAGAVQSALAAKYRNAETGASAHAPRVMLKIVLLACSRGLNTSRRIEAACRQNVLFMALSGDSQPSYTHIAKFVRELAAQIQPGSPRSCWYATARA